MLVLSRREMESVIINPGTPYEVTVMLVDIRGDKARLGFAANPNIVIHRKEVVDAINRKQEATSKVD